MTKISSSSLYREALESLERIKQTTERSPDVQAIARLFLYVAPLEIPEPLFPYVGAVDDPRDIAVIESYTAALEAVVSGDDDDEY
jgi:hypothetical protein